MDGENAVKRRKTCSESGTTTTVRPRSNLPEEVLDSIWTFLGFEDLLSVRCLSKRMSGIANAILSKRATRALPKGSKFWFQHGKFNKAQIQVKRGWTENFTSLNRLIKYALSEGRVSEFLDKSEAEHAANRLRAAGRYADVYYSYETEDSSYMVEWLREVDYIENGARSCAIGRLGEMFQYMEELNKLKFDYRHSFYVYERPDEEVLAERTCEERKIQDMKRLCFSLLYGNKSNKVSMSSVRCKNCEHPSHHDYTSSDVVVHLSNNVQIRFSTQCETGAW